MKKLFTVVILISLVGLLFSTQKEKEILDPLNHHSLMEGRRFVQING